VHLVGEAQGARLLETGAGEALGEGTAPPFDTSGVLFGLAHLLFQRIALGDGPISAPFQGRAQTGELLQAVKDIPMARHPGPGQRLTGPQAAPPFATSGVGDGVVRVQALLGEVQQMNPPGLGVAVRDRRQEVTVSGWWSRSGYGASYIVFAQVGRIVAMVLRWRIAAEAGKWDKEKHGYLARS
jgi:hypothetical protein